MRTMLKPLLLGMALIIPAAVTANAQTYYYQRYPAYGYAYPTYSYPYSAYGYYGYPGYYGSSYYYPAARYPAPLAYWDPYAYARPYSDGAGPRASGHTGY